MSFYIRTVYNDMKRGVWKINLGDQIMYKSPVHPKNR